MSVRRANTRFVILGVLNTIGPASGYQIRKWIAQSISFFWSESFGQIYPQLERLRGSGLVAELAARKSRRRAQRHFRITPAGRRALRSWLTEPGGREPVRMTHLLKLFFGREATPTDNRSRIAEIAEQNLVRLNMCSEIRRTLLGTDASLLSDLVYWLIVLRSGEVISAARLKWAEDSRALLEAYERGGNPATAALFKKLSAA